jgi:hypothetical protein
MKMQSTYGVFDEEADHIIALVHQHAPLAEVLNTPCPACGSGMVVSFNDDGTGFSLHCGGDPLHITKHQDVADPPNWWRECYEEPTDTSWYWRKWHSYDDAGTLHLKTSGWRADDVRWSGELECTSEHPDYDLWRWILNESGCTKDLISDTDLHELRAAHENAK